MTQTRIHFVDTLHLLKRWIFALLLTGLISACDSGKTSCSVAQECVVQESSDGGGEAGDISAGGSENDDSTGNDSDSDTDTESGAGDNSDSDSADNTAVPVATGLSLLHRNGQTFITWNEPASNLGYNVYRSGSPITTENISSATLLTSRWGPLDSDTSLNRNAVTDVPPYFIIEDLGAPLSDNTGLFVHTVENSGTAYYAVTTLQGISENTTVIANQNTNVVQESQATPKPVLTLSVNAGKGRLYTQYMDYQQWNPTLNGYAFNYFVALPYNYNSAQSYPLQVELHAHGYFPTLLQEVRYQWQVIQLRPLDPGALSNTVHTWWYGHARDHDYKRDGDIPSQGAIENFTEQRVMKSIQEVVANPDFNINTSLTHAYGASMGASGSVSLGLRYPSVFTGIYASEPMMNYKTSPLFTNEFAKLFGAVDRNLPIVNRGLYSEGIRRYGEGGSQPTGVWDWMNHHEQVKRRRADDFSFLMIDFGKADTIIDWQTQGRPTFAALSDARVAYTATAREGIAHTWRGFDAVNENLFRFEVPGWQYRIDLSYPGLHNASGSGRIDPPSSGDDEYQTTLEWSTPHYAFGESIVDEPGQYAITLRSLSSAQTVDVTPRNTQLFDPPAGTVCSWSASQVGNGQVVKTGSVAVDSSGLVTAVQVPVDTGSGTRLNVSCQ